MPFVGNRASGDVRGEVGLREEDRGQVCAVRLEGSDSRADIADVTVEGFY